MSPSLRAIIFLAFLAAAAQAAPDAGKLTLEDLFHPARKVAYVEPLPVTLRWRPDGSLVQEWIDRDQVRGIERLAAPGWESRPLMNRARFLAALAAAGVDEPSAAAAWRAPFTWNEAGDAFLATVGQDLCLVDPARGAARRVTAGPEPKEAPAFSPDGTQVAYLRGNDLFVTDLATGRETRLTAAGGDDHLNGRLDWIYQEEVFHRSGPGAFWWSPDSRRIAFLSLDESQVPRFTLLDEREVPPRTVTCRYPHPGEPNPEAQLGVVDLEGRVTWMEDPHPQEDTLIVQVGWDSAGRLMANYQDRAQTWLECVRFEGDKGSSLVREESRGWWVDQLPLPVPLKDGGFLWRSARTGYNHLYRYDAQGRLRGQLTAGPWDVRELLGVDEKAGKIYFAATQRNPIGLDAYAADLDGTSANQDLQRLTERPGTHALTFNPACTAYLDRWSDVDTPPQLLVMNTEGMVLRQFESRVAPAWRNLRRGRVSFQQVMTRDGVPLETMLVLPPGFTPGRTRCPVVQLVYGGPGAPLVRNAFDPNSLWYHFLAQEGIATWICDNRSASGKGAVSAQGIYHNLGALELEDQLDGLAWLRAQGWADMGRIALCGHSYGGFLTAYALTHSKAWKLGVIGAPVVDWRRYDSIYTERYLGLPEENPDGYRASSPLEAAGGLSGKLLLIQGTLDQNVHPQHTLRFLDALQKAGAGAPVILLPGSGHSVQEPRHIWAMYQAIWEFLQKNL
jgi:dipeptidyl-peptidase-4